MRDTLREMVRNLAFERIKSESDNDEYVKYRSLIKKDKDSKDSDYIINSKPLDEYVDDIFTTIDLALEEERIETIRWLAIMVSLISFCVLVYFLL
nr:MAG TPA: hypothetical protein [Caudoviricetes sp.]